ncbi:MAG TPA: hypothetical protein DDW94_01270 [Deltaproteobacteria bacterium]|nr:MAG: hypothetical protein A2Z79_06640 [Deltaproteobacteria bacterium GWA2_55_82]OGQ63308.1 MAG: hypothetical protein A3I81_00960 [Deltaproteobacteria bacterium RIFCSPLOWO2_02_FULL_55_12]OIJ73144.1 MAG: hypothetical protein A2V21_302025 [Deltaproteobacteria bacterium GWC2_55_46]HBG45602.1 hypothetical protein [Deltaproteobacteria bacterium]HCY10433.1 hypothetical protein [Deltaproteobacteria bacterium]
MVRSLKYLVAIFPLVAFLALGISSCDSAKQTAAPQPASSVTLGKGGETRPTLPASNFTGETAAAYQAAAEVPEVLDGLYCYCDCEKNFGHKSLLSCFVDEHGANCDICIYEAIMAHDLHKKGVDMNGIKKAIDERFSHLRH